MDVNTSSDMMMSMNDPQQQQFKQEDDASFNANDDGSFENGGQLQGQKRAAQDYDNASNSNISNDNSSTSDSNNQKKRLKTGNNSAAPGGGRRIEMRILLPSKDAGAIIGRGGANIKKLRSEHKTIIQVPDCDGPERLLLVTGDADASIDTILDIIPLLEENQKLTNSQLQDGTELRLLVHQSQAGCIIGRGGEKIKELRTNHNLDMKVYSECAPMSTERIAQMKGKASDIVNCLREVLALLDTAPPKGMNRPYDPHNFNEFLASQYGGYMNDNKKGGGAGMGGGPGGGGRGGGHMGGGGFHHQQRGGGGGHMGGGPPRHFNGGGMGDRGGRGGGHGGRGGGGMGRGGGPGGPMRGGPGGRGGIGGRGGFGGPGGRGGGGRGGFQQQHGGYGGPQGGGGGGSGYGGRPAGGPSYNGGGGASAGGPGGGNVTSNQVTIPNDLAGAIIGPKGVKIQQIRDQSGAGITIDKPTPGVTDRIITITGSPDQIQNAQYLLQMTVKQSGLWHGN